MTRVDFCDAAAARITAAVALRGLPVTRESITLLTPSGGSVLVRISRTPMPGGRLRAWFHCPVTGCDRRVAHLYVCDSFACRTCAGLPYPTSRFHRDGMWESWGRSAYRMSKVDDQLRRPRIRLARRGRLEKEAERLALEVSGGLVQHGEQRHRR